MVNKIGPEHTALLGEGIHQSCFLLYISPSHRGKSSFLFRVFVEGIPKLLQFHQKCPGAVLRQQSTTRNNVFSETVDGICTKNYE